jgi:hypothetical protein
MKTHKVLDLAYTVEEGQDIFTGTYKECCDFIVEQGSASFIYEIVPLTHEKRVIPLKITDMNKKKLIEKYYKRNNIMHYSDNKYSKHYTKWLERKLLKRLNGK